MNLLQAFEETIAGKEDRAGVTMVDVYVSKAMDNARHSLQDKLDELQSVIASNLTDIERKWFLLANVVSKWELASEELSESIRAELATNSPNLPPMARYHGLRAMGKAAGGLLPSDVLNEKVLKEATPKLWAELLLNAYQNGNPSLITAHLVELVNGNQPKMAWQSLRALLPEMRIAYGSSAELRKQIANIAREINDKAAQKGLLEAAEKRIGGIVANGVVKVQKTAGRRKHFDIPSQAIIRDIGYSKKLVSPDGQLALACG
ncbi:hypothetical protein [Rhodobacter lacus]|uniref:Uncharacterized protein n=1 Tax=Rhodobacter lacus TaxID=1641972 RepID=A0ABW5AAI1_9RHOB